MSATNKDLPRANGLPAPGFYNESADEYQHLEGQDGASRVRVEDGHDVTKGAKADAAQTDPSQTASEIALIKGLLTQVNASLVALNSAIGSNGLLMAGSDGANARAIKTNSDGEVLTQVNGSSITDSQAVPTTQAQKDITAKAIDNIISTIGLENIKLFLPMWEASGSKAYDLINRDLTFTINGATLAQSGLLGNCMSFDGSNDYLIQDPVTVSNLTGTTDRTIISATSKRGQILEPISTTIKFVRLRLKLVGSLPDASVVAKIYSVSGGVADSLLATSEALACSEIGTSYENRGFVFTTALNVQKGSSYAITLEYADGTAVDASNYVSWASTARSEYEYDRLFDSGAGWSASSDGSMCFDLYNNDLTLDEDYSIISVFNRLGTTVKDAWVYSCCGMVPVYGSSIIMGLTYMSAGYMYARACDGSIRTLPIYKYPSGVFNVMATTFSKANSTGKIKTYLNGKPEYSQDGTADTAQTPNAQPFTFGAYVSLNGALSAHINANLGMQIITKSELSASAIAAVTAELLGLRKYQVEV